MQISQLVQWGEQDIVTLKSDIRKICPESASIENFNSVSIVQYTNPRTDQIINLQAQQHPDICRIVLEFWVRNYDYNQPFINALNNLNNLDLSYFQIRLADPSLTYPGILMAADNVLENLGVEVSDARRIELINSLVEDLRESIPRFYEETKPFIDDLGGNILYNLYGTLEIVLINIHSTKV